MEKKDRETERENSFCAFSCPFYHSHGTMAFIHYYIKDFRHFTVFKKCNENQYNTL